MEHLCNKNKRNVAPRCWSVSSQFSHVEMFTSSLVVIMCWRFTPLSGCCSKSTGTATWCTNLPHKDTRLSYQHLNYLGVCFSVLFFLFIICLCDFLHCLQLTIISSLSVVSSSPEPLTHSHRHKQRQKWTDPPLSTRQMLVHRQAGYL